MEFRLLLGLTVQHWSVLLLEAEDDQVRPLEVELALHYVHEVLHVPLFAEDEHYALLQLRNYLD